MSIIGWRLQLIQRVLSGQHATMSLGQLAMSIAPGRIRRGATSSEARGSDTVWHSPLGDFYGPADEPHGRWAIQMMVDENLGSIYEQGGAIIRKGDIVMDCGANVGVFTRLALVRGAATVIALEPNARNADQFRRNFAPELAKGSVILLEMAAWNRSDVLSFEKEDITFRIAAEPTSVQVRAERIDDILTELKLPRLDFIKMDIEGAERYALEGAAGILKKFRPRLALCTYHIPDDPQAMEERIMAANPAYQKLAASQQVYYW